MNYYNDHDPKACAWLRELIAAKLIPPGEIDSRSIVDVTAVDLVGYTQCHFFAGIGGWPYALALAGWPEDRSVWTGSCPCQPFSGAGQRMGEADERHVWPYFRNLIGECRPATIFGEQVASPDALEWLTRVSADLEMAGYAVGAADLCAAGVAAPHRRQRLFWGGTLAHTHDRGCKARGGEQPQAAESQGGNGELEQRGGAGGVVQPHGAGRDTGKSAGESAGHRRTTEPTGGHVWMGESEHAGLEGLGGDGHDRNQSGRIGQAADGSAPKTGAGGVANAQRPGREMARDAQHDGHADGGGQADRVGSAGDAWSRYDILAMLDGKSRRLESGTFPLAHGVSGRVGLLRGYGNAIVPQVAAEFITILRELLPPSILDPPSSP